MDSPQTIGQPVASGYAVRYQIGGGQQTNGQQHLKDSVGTHGPTFQPHSGGILGAKLAPYHQTPTTEYGQQQSFVHAPELEILRPASRLTIKRKLEPLDIFKQWQTGRRYSVHSDLGQLIFYALEDVSKVPRCFWAGTMPLCVRILDKNGIQIATVASKPFAGCCTNGQRGVTFELPPGRLFAEYEHEFGAKAMAPIFYVVDPHKKDLMYKIQSPVTASFGSFANVDFEIMSRDRKSVIGHIGKDRSERMIRERVTSADEFNVTVPKDMDTKWKMALIAAAFSVGYQFYDKDNQEYKTRLGL